MFRLFQCLAVLLVCSPAFAGMPPKEFDHPFAGKITKHLVPYHPGSKAVVAMCKKLAVKWGSPYAGSDPLPKYGCSFGGKLAGLNYGEIVYSVDPTGADRAMKDNTFRHERGHLNGWPVNHPNALP